MVLKRHPSRAKTHSKRTVGRKGNTLQLATAVNTLLTKCFRVPKPISLSFTHSLCQMKPNFPGNDILRLFPITERERKLDDLCLRRFKKFNVLVQRRRDGK